MDSPNYRVRRATLDDLSPMMALWQAMRLPADELAKRITEFQVAEGADGKIVGAAGLQVAQRQGRIHSETFLDFSQADLLRPLLWDRVQAVARNHGLLRLWTQEKAPFWGQSGMVPADAEALKKLPELWRSAAADWLTLKLKEDIETVLSLDKEFALFMESEKQRTARAFDQARILKLTATFIAFALLLLVLAGALLVLKKNPNLLRR